jgi:hypothetical protein
LLLVNKQNAAVSVNLPADAMGARLEVVDVASGENPARRETVSGTSVTLAPFAVAVIWLRR